jgi:hypothetical protein
MKHEVHTTKLSITSIAARNACPVCVALREFQNELLKHLRPEECHRFCNTHGWVVANSAPAESAVTIFLNAVLSQTWRPASPVSDECDLCNRMQEEKERRLGEIVDQLQEPRLRSWLHDYGMLCSRHGRDVMAKLPEPLQKSVQELITSNRREIAETLEDFLQRVKQGSHVGGGVLGRAAEFLVAQRGIET